MIISKKQIIIFIVTLLFIISFSVFIFLFKNQKASQPKENKQTVIEKITNNPSQSSEACEYVKITESVLSPDKFLNIITKTKKENIRKFLYTFLNLDNIASDSAIPMNIRFDSQKDFKISHTSTESGMMWDMILIEFADMDKPDLNWNGEKPKRIKVDVYFEDIEGNKTGPDPKCEVRFDME